jgi:hypothetical protein
MWACRPHLTGHLSGETCAVSFRCDLEGPQERERSSGRAVGQALADDELRHHRVDLDPLAEERRDLARRSSRQRPTWPCLTTKRDGRNMIPMSNQYQVPARYVEQSASVLVAPSLVVAGVLMTLSQAELHRYDITVVLAGFVYGLQALPMSVLLWPAALAHIAIVNAIARRQSSAPSAGLVVVLAVAVVGLAPAAVLVAVTVALGGIERLGPFAPEQVLAMLVVFPLCFGLLLTRAHRYL